MRRQIAFKHVVSAVALLLMLVLAISYLYDGVLGKSLTRQPDTLTVKLATTGGLFESSGVTYRGVRVGTVDRIARDEQGVVVVAKLNTRRKIPLDSTAVVRSLSPAGEQFLDIQPHSSGPPYLKDGELIGETKTATPTTVATALGSIDRLVGTIDEKDLATVLSELSDALADPDQLERLLSSSKETLDLIDRSWPATLRTLENGRTVLRTGVDKQSQFSEFATSSRDLAAWLRDYDPKLRSIIDTTPGQIEQLHLLLSEFALKLPEIFDDAVSLTDIVVAREPHLRELLKTFPRGAERLGDTLHDGRFNVNLLIAEGTVCSYGNDAAPPKETDRTPLNTDGMCAASFSAQQRGAAHTPPTAR